jgi:phospholipid/cholesterol/gamma-HCH transport system substrate-binding protein
MNESSNKHNALVGLFIFIGLAFLLGGILIVGNLRETFNRKMGVVSLFEDVGGLQRGNNVWLSGVKIGTVSNLGFYGKSQVEVSMNIEKKAQKYIPKNAKVKLSNDGLIGNKILVIYGGTENTIVIQEGDTLGVEKTFTSEDMINTLQENNKNLMAITNDFKIISKKLAVGEGTMGKLLYDSTVYMNIKRATVSLQNATVKADQLIGSLVTFSSGLNKKGTLANELTTDTIVFNSVKTSVIKLQQMADTASLLVTNLKNAERSPNSTIGVLLHDEEAGADLKKTITNLKSGSLKLDEDLEAVQHNFLLRGFFRKKAKAVKSDLPSKTE